MLTEHDRINISQFLARQILSNNQKFKETCLDEKK